MTFPRCQSCNGRIALRWRKCPWCKQPSSAPWFPHYPFIDRDLSTYRTFTIGASLWFFLGAAALGLVNVPAAIGLALCGVVNLALAIGSPWHSLAWRLSLISWPFWVLAGVVVTGLKPTAFIGAVLLLPVMWGLMRHRRVTARLEGRKPEGELPRSEVPRAGQCEWCTSRDTELIAPLYVFSAVYVTARSPGRYASVCERHAVIAALPAIAFSLVVGWWGIPWGPIWTLDALVRNVTEGGVLMSSDLAHELRQKEAQTGSAEDPTVLSELIFGFVFGAAGAAWVAFTGTWL